MAVSEVEFDERLQELFDANFYVMDPMDPDTFSISKEFQKHLEMAIVLIEKDQPGPHINRQFAAFSLASLLMYPEIVNEKHIRVVETLMLLQELIKLVDRTEWSMKLRLMGNR